MQSNQFTWQIAWDYQAFRIKFILGMIILVAILIFIPHFFSLIEAREGRVLNDKLLANIPAKDVSSLIFVVLYAMIGLFLYRMSKNTIMCLTALWAFIFLCLTRIITITLVPLNPPADIINLADPCSIFFYHSNVITKDLFFSGHTATVFLGALCMERKNDKMLAFIATVIIAILLLIQHVHYTADIIAAPIFTWVCWYLGKSMAKI
ncbi:MAG: phosphatase PAP2-related protein [Candidatus Pedobacter colombiensis]|uniref:Phosphatase PAP2-related protein n=1 Tax=Candidatus Pedobacter colombiensis TaxID=3121371 RepID=A0AAJ5WC24_9SPHI|nr:phosphatase PAP2-related protein [Pedobacter sp.]WEK21530.1 MAG: phosphatase PAP2-related protein [Pedobacter sp.]